MSQPEKNAKRKAKLKARRAQDLRSQQSECNRIANAIIELCSPIFSEYVDDSGELDLLGRSIAWRLGMIAWNIAVTGRNGIGDAEIQRMKLDPEDQQSVKADIDGIVRRKYEQFPAMRTAIAGLSVERSGADAKPKVKLGNTFPEMPIPDFDSPAQTEQNITPSNKETPMKHSFYDVKARQKVTAEVTDFVSYGEGKTKRFAFKAQTKDGRNLTAFVSKEDWEKAKKK